MLADATTVLVHICGGEDMTLYEVELLMEGLTKHIPNEAHLLFGAATDRQMKDALSVTVISALPEERLQMTSPVEEEVKVEKVEEVVEDAEEEDEVAEEEVDETVNEPHLTLVDEEDEESEEAEEEEVGEDLSVEYDLEPDELDEMAAPGLKFVEEEVETEEVVQEPETDLVSDEPVVEEVQEGPVAEAKTRASKSKRQSSGQGELLLEGVPKGRFDGEEPNVSKDGEDLDIPPYLRKKRRR